MKNQIEKAILELKYEGIVAIPTETVYGLAGNAFSRNAVKKIFELKSRPSNNPLIVHIGKIDDLSIVARDIPDTAYLLARYFWPGPLTLVLKKQDAVPHEVTSGLDTVAVRIPDHPITLNLLNKLEFPLAAPSANPFGAISPTNATHVQNYFQDRLRILNGGNSERGIESTIVSFDEKHRPVILRHGSITVKQIEIIVGKVGFLTLDESKPSAPGMFSRHYSPRTVSYLTEDVPGLVKEFPGRKIGLLLFDEKLPESSLFDQEILSKTGDFREAAKNLYSAMHRLDQKRPDLIIFQRLPNIDLGITINDKLQRAAERQPVS